MKYCTIVPPYIEKRRRTGFIPVLRLKNMLFSDGQSTISQLSTVLMTESTNAPNVAAQKPLTSKPATTILVLSLIHI